MQAFRAALIALTLACIAGATLRAAEPDSAHGGKLFKRYCSGCHGIDGRGDALTFMPHIGNLTKADYIEYLPDEYLVGVITNGGPSVGKSSYMPAWGSTLSPQDILDIVAHIRTLPTY